MPSTPIIGISVLVHVAIIVFHKIFHIKEQEDAPIKKVSKKQYVFSCLIVLVMFSLMLFTAAGLLNASLTERHSTIYLIEDTAQWLAGQTDSTQILATAEAVYLPQAGPITLGVLLVLGLLILIPRIKFTRTKFSLPQGGHSLVQVSLLVSGLLSALVGATYIVLYLLITTITK